MTMSLQFSPEAQRIIEELPGVQAEFNATSEALRATERELGGFAHRHSAIVTAHETAVADLTQAHSRAVFHTYDRRLQKAMTVIASDADNPFAVPSPEVCEQVAQLDEVISTAAGQPVIVTKPGEGWFDIGLLAPADRPEETGLQIAYEHVKEKCTVELPLNHTALAIDSQTGQEPRSTDSRYGDLRRRLFIAPHSGERVRPAIDPLRTLVVASDVSPIREGNAALTAMNIAEVMEAVGNNEQAEPDETTYVLIGYTAMQQVFNAILGFQPDLESTETWLQFRRANDVEQRFQEAGIGFDADCIDGVLSYKIATREEHAEQVAPSFYENMLLHALKTKRAQLIEAGLISV